MADLEVLSLGVGWQSTTMAAMAAMFEISPMPDCAIFADTQCEPKAVYDYLEWLRPLLPFPVYQVSQGNLMADCVRNAAGEILEGACPVLPVFCYGKDGKPALLTRQCTQDYKIAPIRRKIRELLGVGYGERVPSGVQVVQWIGISTDEAARMKPSRDKWAVHRWPLIEAGMSRRDCGNWLTRNGYPLPPKSACIICPFHSDRMWRDMRDSDPESWQIAVEFDRAIRNGFKGSTAPLFLHRSMVPLDEVIFAADTQLVLLPNGFINECEGMCGV